MRELKRVKLAFRSSDSGTYQKDFSVRFSDVQSDFASSEESLKGLLSWKFSGKNIIFTAKPEGFGVARIGNILLEVYPKFAIRPETIDHAFLTNLFTLSPKVSLGKLFSTKQLSGDHGLFDFYFYSVLSNLRDFLKRYNRLIHTSSEEDVVGIRGRLKISATVAKFGELGLRNICEISSLDPRYEFLSLLKAFATHVGDLTNNEDVALLASQIVASMREIQTVKLSTERIRKLKSMSRLLIAEYKPSQPLIESMIGMLELIDSSTGQIHQKSFCFNMNFYFELLVNELAKKYASQNDFKFNSGNHEALQLLQNSVSGVTIENEDDSFNAVAIKIKPDGYLTKKEIAVLVLDAKYKVLNYDSDKKILRGVQSRDIQQLLSYWLHFFDSGKSKPRLILFYPHPSPDDRSESIQLAGTVKMSDPTAAGSHIEVEICLVNVERALRLIKSANYTAESATALASFAS